MPPLPPTGDSDVSVVFMLVSLCPCLADKDVSFVQLCLLLYLNFFSLFLMVADLLSTFIIGNICEREGGGEKPVRRGNISCMVKGDKLAKGMNKEK